MCQDPHILLFYLHALSYQFAFFLLSNNVAISTISMTATTIMIQSAPTVPSSALSDPTEAVDVTVV